MTIAGTGWERKPSMAEFPSMPLWTDAYLGDTTHLTTLEHGAYLLLLMIAWRSKETSLPDDDRLLARYTKLSPSQWKRIKPILAEFFAIENGRWIQKRLLDESNAVKQYRERQRAAGKASALKRKGRHSTTVDSGCNHSPTPTPSPSPKVKDTTNVVSKKRATRLPDDWEPKLTEKAQGVVNGWPDGKLETELIAFKDHAADKGRTSKDWQAAFRTWISNAEKWRKGNGGNRTTNNDEIQDPYARAAARREADRLGQGW